jgi:Transposase DDE domain
MTILVFFPVSHDRTFQHFYFAHMLLERRGEFPTLPSYTRFVELIPRTLLPLCADVPTRKGAVTGLPFIDSLPIRVCHNRRLSWHQVLAGLASAAKAAGVVLWLPTALSDP